MKRSEALKQARGPLAMTEENWQKVVAGEKTQTRRIVNPQPPEDMPRDCIKGPELFHPTKINRDGFMVPGDEVFGIYDTFGEWGAASKCQPGEIYYLPEPVWIIIKDDFKSECRIKYLWAGHEHWRWVSPDDIARIDNRKRGWNAPTTARFMLKSFARKFIRIKSVKVERLQDITPDDCRAEGMPAKNNDVGVRYAFGSLWNSIHGPGAWDANPWVWVYEFERLEVLR